MDSEYIKHIEDEEIDLLEILRALKEKILAIILCGVICAGIAAVYCFFIAKPVYQSTAKMYVLTKTTSITSIADIQLSSSLAQDYQEMVTSRPVVNEVISILGLDCSYGSLVGAITVENPSNTRILKISVQNTDPELAAQIANTLANVSKESISSIMRTDAPQIFEKATVAQYPIKPNKTKTVGIGLFLGLILASIVVTIKYITNDKIKTSYDVEKATGLIVLSMIPDEKVGGAR